MGHSRIRVLGVHRSSVRHLMVCVRRREEKKISVSVHTVGAVLSRLGIRKGACWRGTALGAVLVIYCTSRESVCGGANGMSYLC